MKRGFPPLAAAFVAFSGMILWASSALADIPSLAEGGEPRKAYTIDADYLGDVGQVDPIFVRGECVPACVEAEYQKAVDLCTSPAVQAHLQSLPYGPYLLDDCIVAGYFLGNPTLTGGVNSQWQAASRTGQVCYVSDGEGCSYAEGVWYLDEECNMVNPADYEELLNAGTLRWPSSPISLLWEDNVSVETGVGLSSFPLDPGKHGWWYEWKASDKAPLLVYDPEHRGVITSAHQLFGNWSFGGKRHAALARSAAAAPWANGFEALATLDRNGDNELSGEELAPLALWCDGNRDGVSQQGEGKPVAELAIGRIYYTPNRTDAVSGAVYADRGYERLVDGTPVMGAAVDWYAASSPSRYGIINAQTLRALAPAANAERQHLYKNAAGDDPARFDLQQNVRGVWKWRVEDPGFEGDKAFGGFLSFRDLGDGKITGHSFVTSKIDSEKLGVKTMAAVFFLEGTKAVADGKTTITYGTGGSKAKPAVSSVATLSADGNTLSGKTSSSMSRDGKSYDLGDSWSAERIRHEGDL